MSHNSSCTVYTREDEVTSQPALRAGYYRDTLDGGIILAAQSSWTLSGLIAALDRLLSDTRAEDWVGQVRWLER